MPIPRTRDLRIRVLCTLNALLEGCIDKALGRSVCVNARIGPMLIMMRDSGETFRNLPTGSAQARLSLRTWMQYGLARELPSEYLDICPDASGLKPVLIDQSCHVKATPTDKSLG